MKCLGLVAAWTVGALWGYAPLAHSAVIVTTVGFSGQQAADLPGGARYASFGASSPVINNAGQIQFNATVMGTGVTSGNYDLLWAGVPSELKALARYDSAPPGTNSAQHFNGFSFRGLNAQGQSAFLGDFYGTGTDFNNDRGLFTGVPGNVAQVARTGSPAPGAPVGQVFSSLGDAPLFNASGLVGFADGYKTPGAGSPTGSGVWTGTAGNVQLVTRSTLAAPGTPYAFDGAMLSALNDSGSVGMSATLGALSGGSAPPRPMSGVWTGSSGSNLQALAVTGGAAPPTGTAQLYYSTFSPPKLNNAGQVLFAASLQDGSNKSAGEALFSGEPGALQLVAMHGQQAPGAPAGQTFGSFIAGGGRAPILINHSGVTAFIASLSGSTPDHSTPNGLFVGTPGNLQLIARTGDEAPGTGGLRYGFDYTGSNPMSLNAQGEIAFISPLVGEDGQGGTGLFVADPSGAVQLVMRTNTSINVPGSGTHTLSLFSMALGSGNEDGGQSFFNDNGQLVFAGFFQDSSSALFVASVPEPGSAAMIGAMGVWLLLLKRRRRLA
jgi:hypothetical protein